MTLAGKPHIPFRCLSQLLEHRAQHLPDAQAILGPGRAPLTYRVLYQHIRNTGHTLRAMGVGRRDRVALVLQNGPEASVAILAVATSAICAPVNPAYQAEELERYFADLRPDALITQAAIDSPARRVATSRGIQVIELSPTLDAEAGLFTLAGNRHSTASDEALSPNDVAVLLPTSGTTSRPKIVPQTHANICASAFGSVAALALTESDRCLNVVPVFHGHGLHASVIASLAAGGSVVCTPGFDAKNFCAWLTTLQPTWYSAVPAVHQAILAQAAQLREWKSDCRLRFIRSSSAPLPPLLFKELERTFEAPVIEYYGMAEAAASPIACNPLPPRQRKPGSVGVRVSLDVTIVDEQGAQLPVGATGEVVVRGESVVSGYDRNPMATKDSFVDGWLKTGDLGYFDEDGYLFLVGRAREIINRGGDKIAPREIDEVLLEHPAVAEAATFPVRHPTLGEDIAAALVLRPSSTATARDIRQFARSRLADFKIPRQVLFVREIPKGPTGKVRRIGLAAELGLAGTATHAFIAPRTPIEKALAACWVEALELEHVGIHDDFFVLGGDSLMAAQLLTGINERLHVDVEVSRFFDGPTVAELARYIESSQAAGQAFEPISAIARAPRQNGFAPASIAQERIWSLQQALPDVPFFNILYALRIKSPLDVAALERSINEIVKRHEILRTSFVTINGECVQVVAPRLSVSLAFDDLRALRRFKKEAPGQKLVREESLRCFDLAKGPLIRARLVRLAEHEHVLLLAMHHAICDGWSLGVFVEELAALYDAFVAQKELPLAPLPIQYADFARWQRDWQSHSEIVAQLDYWRDQLGEPLPSMRLAVSRPKQTGNTFGMTRRAWAMPASLSQAIKRFSHQEGATLFMTLVAALQMLLHRYLHQDEVRVAATVANRNRPEAESLIGPLVNTVILRTNLAGDPTAREVMQRVRATCFAAFANQDLPFEELAEVLDRERGLELGALSNVMISLQNETLRPLKVDCSSKLAFEEANAYPLMPVMTLTTFDVMINLRENSHGLVGICAYKPHLFTAGTIDSLLRDFEGILGQMVRRPARPISKIQVSQGASHR